jgi:hypothetical protein
MKKEYRTTNLYEASFLACRGFKFTGKEERGRKMELLFPQCEGLQAAVADFYSGGMVSAKQYSDWYRSLKDYVFG